MWPSVYVPDFNILNIIELEIDHSKTGDTAEVNIPILAHISTRSGATGSNLKVVINKMISSSNYLKIAVADSQGNQQYIESFDWDLSADEIWLVFRATDIFPKKILSYYFYFDITESDNTAYVGNIGSTPGQTVHDSNYKTVQWLQNDPTGSPASKDSTINAIDGTNIGSLQSSDLVPGKVGNALDVEGIAGGIRLGAVAALQITGDLTMEAIFKTGSTLSTVETIYMVTVGDDDTSSTTNALGRLAFQADGKLNYFHEFATGSNVTVITDTSYLSPNTWYYVMISRDDNGSGGSLTFYVGDGVNWRNETKSYANSPTDGSSSVASIGYEHQSTGPAQIFDGIVNNVRISNIARSSSYADIQYYSFFRQNLITYSPLIPMSLPVNPTAVQSVAPVIVDEIIEIELDLGTQKIGAGNTFDDVQAILGKVSSFSTKIDPKNGFSTFETLTIVVQGRDNFAPWLAGAPLHRRRITRKTGRIESGFTYANYTETFTGLIKDWAAEDDLLTIWAEDDLMETAEVELPKNDEPTEIEDGDFSSGIQHVIYQHELPLDIMRDQLIGGITANNPITGAANDNLGISAARVNSKQFIYEQDLWLSSVYFNRVIIKPTEARELLNQLQFETGCFLTINAPKIGIKSYSPLTPGSEALAEHTDEYTILSKVKQKSGYKNFFNVIIALYDYDEETQKYESEYMVYDLPSQSASEMNDKKVKEIEFKSVKSLSYNQPNSVETDLKGVIIYHVSKWNGDGSGTLTYNNTNKTLTWKSPGDSVAGGAVVVDQNGQYQLKSDTPNEFIRVSIKISDIDASDSTAIITLSNEAAKAHVGAMAFKKLNIYSHPVGDITYTVDREDVENVKSGSITVFGDAGSGQVTVTSVSHSLYNGLTVKLKDNTNYLDVYVITNVTDDTFEITETWNGDDAQGTWIVQLRPSNFITLTTDQATLFNKETLSQELVMVSEVTPLPDKDQYQLTVIVTHLNHKYAWIAPVGTEPDYDSASDADKEFCYIADADGTIGVNDDPAYVIVP